MATKPTREQERGAELITGALLAIAEAARLDGRSRLDAAGFQALVDLASLASSAIDREALVGRALATRIKRLGLPSDTADLLALTDPDFDPLLALTQDDAAFRERVARAEAELGEA
jgi:hypothetical protein